MRTLLRIALVVATLGAPALADTPAAGTDSKPAQTKPKTTKKTTKTAKTVKKSTKAGATKAPAKTGTKDEAKAPAPAK